MLPLLADAVASQRTWLSDFEDDDITISADLYEVLLAYQYFRSRTSSALLELPIHVREHRGLRRAASSCFHSRTFATTSPLPCHRVPSPLCFAAAGYFLRE